MSEALWAIGLGSKEQKHVTQPGIEDKGWSVLLALGAAAG